VKAIKRQVIRVVVVYHDVCRNATFVASAAAQVAPR
jgi:hypothetical protein